MAGEIGDAPVPGSEAAGGEADAGDVVSFEDALKGAIEETGATDVEETTEDEGAADAETEEVEAKTDDKPKDDKAKPKKDEKKDEPDEAKVSEKNRKEFAALARERGKLKDREASLVAKEEKLAAIEPKAKAFDDVRRRIHADPVGLLREAGGDALLDKVLDELAASEKSPEMREVEKLRAEREAEKAQLKAERDAQTVANWRREIQAEVVAGGEKFDLVNSLGEYDAVVEVMTSYFAKHKANLPVAIAAQVIEEGLEKGLAKSKKFGARGAVTPTQASNGTPPPTKKKSNTTLSSVAVGAVPQGDDDGPMDEVARAKWAMGLAVGA